MPKTKIYIGRLPRDAKQSELEDEFGQVGKIRKVELRSNYAFIVFDETLKTIFIPLGL